MKSRTRAARMGTGRSQKPRTSSDEARSSIKILWPFVLIALRYKPHSMHTQLSKPLLASFVILSLLGAGCESTQDTRTASKNENATKVTNEDHDLQASATSTKVVSPPSEGDVIKRLASANNAVPDWGRKATYSTDLLASAGSEKRVTFSANLDDLFTEKGQQYAAMTFNNGRRPWRFELKITADQAEKLRAIEQEQRLHREPLFGEPSNPEKVVYSIHRFAIVASIEGTERIPAADGTWITRIRGVLIAAEGTGNTQEAKSKDALF